MQFLTEVLYFILEIFAVMLAVNIATFIFLVIKHRNAENKSSHNEPNQIIKQGHIVNQESYNGIFYWYDENTKEFLVQGKNLEEIVAGLKVRFPDRVFILPTGHTIFGPDWKLIKLTD